MALLLDLDGTLLDTAPDIAYAINSVRATLNMSALTVSTIRFAVSEGLEALIKIGFGMEPHHPTYEATGQRCLKIYQAHLARNTKPFPGMLELLEDLDRSHIPWGIVTNKPTVLTEALLKKLDLWDRAGCVVSGDTLLKAKPHPEPLWYACEQLNILPENAIYIGDAARDIQAGKAAGMFTIGALFGYIESVAEAFSWQADHYIYRAEEMGPYLKKHWIPQWLALK